MADDRIVVSAVVLRDPSGRVLTVRKRGTSRFILPGGKVEDAEDVVSAAVREVAEELAVAIDPARLTLLGTWTAPAANEAGRMVTATVYEHPFVAVEVPGAEIEEFRWVSPGAPDVTDLAPLLADDVFPRL